jgi:nitroimidazol reductase NimA-like FMN-containing flavoprotein (pyridoxamine 5'-phosphate oxidase superfamily)
MTAVATTVSYDAPLSPTARTTVNRGKERGLTDRAALVDVLDSALICHLGVDVGHPLVLPTAFGYDLDGPDEAGSLYVHGSVASHSLVQARSNTLCVTLTVLDGLIAARSAFHHSMNYRSAVILGEARQVTDDDERRHALALIVDHMIPGRSATLRPHLRKELAATGVIALPLHEASVKARSGGPVDEPDDYESVGGWAGEIPLRVVADEPVPDDQAVGAVPAEVLDRAQTLGSTGLR